MIDTPEVERLAEAISIAARGDGLCRRDRQRALEVALAHAIAELPTGPMLREIRTVSQRIAEDVQTIKVQDC